MRQRAFALLLPLLVSSADAQTPAAADALRVDVRSGGRPIEGAAVRVDGEQRTTDSAGQATLGVAQGEHEVSVEAPGYLPASLRAAVGPGAAAHVTVELMPLEEEVNVTAARSATRLQDQPLRVEVIDRDDIEEKALMTPGSVAMLLGETTGLRVQTTAPSLGAANVRIQGLRGHYSQLFVNAENLFDVRQTRDEPLLLPARRPDGRWTVDAWAPLDGRVVNGGIRVVF